MSLVLATALILLGALASIAQPVVEALSLATTVLPPSVTTLVFRVTNPSSQERTFFLMAELPAGWAVLAMPQTLTLLSGEADTVLMLVRIPSGGAASDYNASLCATDPIDGVACSAVVVTVEPHLAVQVEVATELAKGMPGHTAQFDLQVTNRGNLTSEFEIVINSQAWPIASYPPHLLLFPGETKTVTLIQSIPSYANPGDSDTIHVNVSSIDDPTVVSHLTLQSGVFPLPASDVSTDLSMVLDTTVDVAIRATAEGVTSSVARVTAEGSAVGGIVKVQATASGFHGGGAFSLSGVTGQFSNDFLAISYGPKSARFGRFVSLSGEGIMLELSCGLFSLDGVSFGTGPAAEQAARFSLNTDVFDGSFGWASLESEGVAEEVRVIELALDVLPGGSFEADFSQGEQGLASRFDASWQSGPATLRGEVVIVRAPFPSQSESNRSIAFDSRVSLSGISMSGNVSHSLTWNPAVPDNKDLDVSTRLSFSGRLGASSFSMSGSVTWEEDWVGAALEDSSTQGISASVSQTLNPSLTMSVSGSLRHELDGVAVTEYMLSDVALRLHATLGLFQIGASLGATITEDMFLNSTSIKMTEQISLARSSGQLPVAFSLTGEQENGDVVSLTGKLSIGDITATISKDEFDDITFGVAYSWQLPVTFSNWLVKGQVEGILYVDENMNGQRDAYERGLEGILLSIDHTQALTDRDGKFRFPPKGMSDYRLQTLNLPAAYVPVGNMPMPIHMSGPGVRHVEVGVVEAASIQGRVVAVAGDQTALGSTPFLLGIQRQTNGNGTISGAGGTVNTGLASIRVTLTDGRTTLVQTTDALGNFRFDRLLPGQWTITVDETSLPRFHEMSTPSAVLQLQPGQVSELEIQVRQIPRPIEMLGIQGKPISVRPTPPDDGE